MCGRTTSQILRSDSCGRCADGARVVRAVLAGWVGGLVGWWLAGWLGGCLSVCLSVCLSQRWSAMVAEPIA